ncbi:hypothetical protein L3X38_018087 [Prunus dulcis]|uniref:Uncharacterized protein n=1 Tax=Prunus dulcis TaxID=3755 RepID=A0AAD4ZAF3_PRUDU|nr:hypothetical protein L3X38_018087 [Prunus dulcis]
MGPVPKGPARPRRHDPGPPLTSATAPAVEKGNFCPVFARTSPTPISLLRPPFLVIKVLRGIGYPALTQAPYVALVVPVFGEIL